MTLRRLPLLRRFRPKLQHKQGRDNVFSEKIVRTRTTRNSKQSCKNQYSSLWIICFALRATCLVHMLRYLVEFTQSFSSFSYPFVYTACPQVYTRDSVENPSPPQRQRRPPLNVWRPTALNYLAHLLQPILIACVWWNEMCQWCVFGSTGLGSW